MNRCEDYCKAYKQLGLTACEGCCGRRSKEKGGVAKWKVLIYLIVVTLLLVV
jgi:hypothetical protein